MYGGGGGGGGGGDHYQQYGGGGGGGGGGQYGGYQQQGGGGSYALGHMGQQGGGGGYGGGGGGGGYGGGGGGGGHGGGGGGGGRPKPNADRTVFIGNIAFDTTEEQLLAHCSAHAIVTHMRLVTDPATGKAKGFAFVEFKDKENAAAAIRNLNGADLNGRALRMDFSDPAHRTAAAVTSNVNRFGPNRELAAVAGGGGRNVRVAAQRAAEDSFESGSSGRREYGESGSVPVPAPQELQRIFATSSGGTSSNMDTSSGAAASSAVAAHPSQANEQRAHVYESSIGSQAPAVAPPAQPYGTDTIAKLVKSLTKPQLLEILSEMKKFSTHNPEGARQLLSDSPQVAQTLLHILILFGLVRPGDVQSIQTSVRPQAGSAPSVGLPAPMPVPTAVAPAVPYAVPPPAALPYTPAPVPVSSLPVPPAPAAPAAAPFTEQDEYMLREIMKLSPEQIAQLPQEVQEKIRMLQQQLEGQKR